MVFDINSKTALITGGASGIGLCTVKELLKNRLKGIAIADVDETLGNKVTEKLNQTFGKNRVIFVKTDVSDEIQFKNAFEKTIASFGSLDILINNAGILDEDNWKQEISVNLYGTVCGTLEAFEKYIPKYKSGNEGIIVNISSINGLDASPACPVYSATKFGIVGLGRALGSDEYYKSSKIKVLTVCPGGTSTPLVLDKAIRKLENKNISTRQEPEHVAKAIVEIIRNGENGSVWVVEKSQEAYEVEFLQRVSRKKVP